MLKLFFIKYALSELVFILRKDPSKIVQKFKFTYNQHLSTFIIFI